jgi:hypothetical protein
VGEREAGSEWVAKVDAKPRFVIDGDVVDAQSIAPRIPLAKGDRERDNMWAWPRTLPCVVNNESGAFFKHQNDARSIEPDAVRLLARDDEAKHVDVKATGNVEVGDLKRDMVNAKGHSDSPTVIAHVLMACA